MLFLARAWRPILLIAAMLLATPQLAAAGGGPHNLLLVVNPRSWSSLTVANHYIQLRQIPASHVLYLDWQGSPMSATADEFRQKILQPVLQAIETRGLAGQIDYVAYSSDFPYRIDATSESPGQAQTGFSHVGTLTSFTYLWQLVQAKQLSPTQMEVNHYFSRQSNPTNPPASRAFRLTTGWDQRGQPSATGRHYLLCTMLAMTSGRGNSVTQALNYLARSASADGTSPEGTIYYCQTNDVRTQVRQSLYGPAVLALRDLGVNAEIANAVLPQRKNDVQGLTFGAATFNWQRSQSTLRPGAICDNLSSTNAFLLDTGNQTAMTELLAAGAAGTSGTVIEPGAIVNKFPSPFIHLHYARGNSLAEAYYQSVHGPYQLLIIGDPLCQPWARAPQVSASGVSANESVSGSITLVPSADGAEVSEFQLLLDGRRVAVCTPGGTLEYDTATAVDGYHELTVVAIGPAPIEVQGRTTFPVVFDNGGHSIALAVTQPKVTYGQSFQLTTSTDGSDIAHIMLFQASRGVAREAATANEWAIDSRILGFGPSRLQAVALDGAGKPIAISPPVQVQVDAPPPLTGRAPPQGVETFRGMELTLASGRKIAARDTAAFNWLERLGVGESENYRLSGYVDVPENDIYQFVFAFVGELNISVDGQSIYRGTHDRGINHWRYVPVSLAAGTHFVEISGKAGVQPRLQVRFGGPGAWLIGERQFRHPG